MQSSAINPILGVKFDIRVDKIFTFAHYPLPLTIPVSAGEFHSHLTRSRVFHVFIIGSKKLQHKASMCP